MTAVRKIVARNLRTLRKAHGLSQDELAVISGIDRSYISDTEREKYGISIDKLESLAGALSVAPWQMLHPLTATGKSGEVEETDGSV